MQMDQEGTVTPTTAVAASELPECIRAPAGAYCSRAFVRVLLTAPDRLACNYVYQMALLEEPERFDCQVEFLDLPMTCGPPRDKLLLQIRGARRASPSVRPFGDAFSVTPSRANRTSACVWSGVLSSWRPLF
jgi:hypothetical protein